MLTTDEISALKKDALEIRALTIGFLGKGHIGGSMSIVEALAILYRTHMRIDPKKPQKPDRDRLVLSKGHAGPALYSALAYHGYFPQEWLHTLNVGGTNLPSHADMNRTPGIDMTAGSLGQGLSAAVGIALANQIDERDYRTYCIIGDGESNEGQIWEAAQSAPQFKLSNLIAFTDYNKMQLDGWMTDIMNVEDLNAKWLAFGWFVQRVDGHDFQQLDLAIRRAQAEQCRPSMIIMDTVKGKGAAIAEGNPANHSMNYDSAAAQEMIDALRAKEAM
jgi:transketolase